MRPFMFIICAVSLLVSCENRSKLTNDWDRLGLNGKVRSFQTITYSKNEELQNPDFTKSTSIAFNEDGFITTVIPSSTFEGFDKKVFNYDSINRKKSIDFFLSGELKGQIKYKYDGLNISEIIPIDKGGKIDCIIKFVYDKEGNMIERLSEGVDGNRYPCYQLRKYDNMGNIIEEINQNSGYGNNHYIFKFYDKKYLIEKITLNEKEEIVETKTWKPEEKKLTRKEGIDPGIGFIYEAFENYNQLKCGETKKITIRTGDIHDAEVSKLKCDNQNNWLKASEGDMMIERQITYY